MQTAKQDAAALINSLPDDTSIEDIRYRLHVLGKIRAGLAEIEAGQDISHEEAIARLARLSAPRSLEPERLRGLLLDGAASEPTVAADDAWFRDRRARCRGGSVW